MKAEEEKSLAGSKGSKARVWNVVFAISLVVFIVSVVALCVIGFSYFQGQAKYDEIAHSVQIEPGDDGTPDGTSDEGLVQATVDWDALLAANPDTAAWLYVPGTRINYPIVQGPDNEYYLTHDFDGEAGWLANYGAVFMDYRNKRDMSDSMTYIYGHHMNDGSMFADLAGFGDQARFDQCRTMYLLTPAGDYRLRTFAFVHTPADEETVRIDFASVEDYAQFVQSILDRSSVNPGEVPAAAQMGRSFALATCDNLSSDGRYILYAYVEQASADGLAGSLGIEMEDGRVVGFGGSLTEAG